VTVRLKKHSPSSNHSAEDLRLQNVSETGFQQVAVQHDEVGELSRRELSFFVSMCSAKADACV
jgi:hypothetical protein